MSQFWIFRISLLAASVAFAAAGIANQPNSVDDSTADSRNLDRLNQAIDADPKSPIPLEKRAVWYASSGRAADAIADYDRLIELEPERAALYDARGSEYFKLGKIEESIADFDRAIKLQPDQEPWHWKRGISYYYAERWDDGRKQFEGYQTVDDNDVENAVWRFLCMARKDGIDAARGDVLKINRDLRVPMMEVYDLYRGELKPDDVLAAAKAGNPPEGELNQRLFYAHLYLGLYYEVTGDAAQAKEHIDLARSHKIGHYMWNVADVHAKRLAAAK